MNSIGVYGVGVMGRGLALNIASRGHRVAIYNKEHDRVAQVLRDARAEQIHTMEGFHTVQDFMASLARPKKVLVMVPAGKPMWEVLDSMYPYVEQGDIIVDGGNEYYKNTQQRQALLRVRHGVHLVGMGVSGGAHGARYGAAFMPGGSQEAVESILPYLRDASNVKSEVSYVGGGGSGHFVKMVHNGIEYAIMQAIAEVYDIFRTVYLWNNNDIADFFQRCNEECGIRSYLLEITCDILRKTDDDEGEGSLLDKIKDVPHMNGTGAWTAKEAFESLVSCPSIIAATDARIVASDKQLRMRLNNICNTRARPTSHDASHDASRDASHDSKVHNLIQNCIADTLVMMMYLSYLQGFQLIHKKSEHEEWGVDIHKLARNWMGGCIIRSNLLDMFADENRKPDDLFEDMMNVVTDVQSAGHMLAMCVLKGIHTPVLSATYQYALGYTTESSPANLIQAQRDYFGSHGYQRIDKPGKFHTESWK